MAESEAVPTYEIQPKLDEELEYFTHLALQETEKWIQMVTSKSFKYADDPRRSLQDGVLLCELLNALKPGCIRKINRLPTPIAYLDNLTVFQTACRDYFGLQEVQLFDIQDLEDLTVRGVLESEDEIKYKTGKKLRNVAITIFWLGKEVRNWFDGPLLNLQLFTDLIEQKRSSSFYEPPSAYDRRQSSSSSLRSPASPQRLDSPTGYRLPSGKQPQVSSGKCSIGKSASRQEPSREIIRGSKYGSAQVADFNVTGNETRWNENNFSSALESRDQSSAYSSLRSNKSSRSSDGIQGLEGLFTSSIASQQNSHFSQDRDLSSSNAAGFEKVSAHRFSPVQGSSVFYPAKGTNADTSNTAQRYQTKAVSDGRAAVRTTNRVDETVARRYHQETLREGMSDDYMSNRKSGTISPQSYQREAGGSSSSALQFVKSGSQPLANSAKQTIDILDQQKITRNNSKQEETDWEANLQSWKSRRRSQRTSDSDDNQSGRTTGSVHEEKYPDHKAQASDKNTQRVIGNERHCETTDSVLNASTSQIDENARLTAFGFTKFSNSSLLNSSLCEKGQTAKPEGDSQLKIQQKYVEKVIKISQRPNHDKGFGFVIEGGKEHGKSVTVSKVTRGGAADVCDLKAGDEIVAINGALLANHYLESVRMVVDQAVHVGQVELTIKRLRSADDDFDEDVFSDDIIHQEAPPSRLFTTNQSNLQHVPPTDEALTDDLPPPLPSAPPPAPNWNTFPGPAGVTSKSYDEVDFIDEVEQRADASESVEEDSVINSSFQSSDKEIESKMTSDKRSNHSSDLSKFAQAGLEDRIFAVVSVPQSSAKPTTSLSSHNTQQTESKLNTIKETVSDGGYKSEKFESVVQNKTFSGGDSLQTRGSLKQSYTKEEVKDISGTNSHDIRYNKNIASESSNFEETRKVLKEFDDVVFGKESVNPDCHVQLNKTHQKEHSVLKDEASSRSSENTFVNKNETAGHGLGNNRTIELTTAWKKQEKELGRAISDAEKEFQEYRLRHEQSIPVHRESVPMEKIPIRRDSTQVEKVPVQHSVTARQETSDKESKAAQSIFKIRNIPIKFEGNRGSGNWEQEFLKQNHTDMDSKSSNQTMGMNNYAVPCNEDQYKPLSLTRPKDTGRVKVWRSTEHLRSQSLSIPAKEEWLERINQDIDELLQSQAKLSCNSKHLDLAAERRRMMKWNEEQEKIRMENFLKELNELKKKCDDDIKHARAMEEEKQKREAQLLEKEIAKQKYLEEVKRKLEAEVAQKERVERLKQEALQSSRLRSFSQDMSGKGIVNSEWRMSGGYMPDTFQPKQDTSTFHKVWDARDDCAENETTSGQSRVSGYVTDEVKVQYVAQPSCSAQIQNLPDSARNSSESLNSLGISSAADHQGAVSFKLKESNLQEIEEYGSISPTPRAHVVQDSINDNQNQYSMGQSSSFVLHSVDNTKYYPSSVPVDENKQRAQSSSIPVVMARTSQSSSVQVPVRTSGIQRYSGDLSWSQNTTSMMDKQRNSLGSHITTNESATRSHKTSNESATRSYMTTNESVMRSSQRDNNILQQTTSESATDHLFNQLRSSTEMLNSQSGYNNDAWNGKQFSNNISSNDPRYSQYSTINQKSSIQQSLVSNQQQASDSPRNKSRSVPIQVLPPSDSQLSAKINNTDSVKHTVPIKVDYVVSKQPDASKSDRPQEKSIRTITYNVGPQNVQPSSEQYSSISMQRSSSYQSIATHPTSDLYHRDTVSQSIQNIASPPRPTSVIGSVPVSSGSSTEAVNYLFEYNEAAPLRKSMEIHRMSKIENASQKPVQSPSNVAGGQRCAGCDKDLGYGRCMMIDSVDLCFHPECFRCSVCRVSLLNQSHLDNVRFHESKAHCRNCYSNQRDGLKFSKV